jgi:hypothetical protein
MCTSQASARLTVIFILLIKCVSLEKLTDAIQKRYRMRLWWILCKLRQALIYVNILYDVKLNSITKLRSKNASSILVMFSHIIYLSSIPWKIFEITVYRCRLKVTLFEYANEDYIKFSSKHSKNSEASHYRPTSNNPYATFLINTMALRGYTNFEPLFFSSIICLTWVSRMHMEQNLNSLLKSC